MAEEGKNLSLGLEIETEPKDGSVEASGPSKATAPMKFSFSKPKGKASKELATKKGQDSKLWKVEQEKEDDRDFVTAMGADEGLVLKDSARRGPKVIPKLENTWRAEGRSRISAASGRGDDLEEIRRNEEIFDAEDPDPVDGTGSDPNVKYGLTLRQAPNEGGEPTEGKSGGHQSFAERELQRLKEDLSELPDEAGEEAYEEMPVEEFGLAMLRGMGWEQGKPIGRNAKGLAEPVEFVPRQGRLGLGATPKLPGPPEGDKSQRILKPGEKRGPKPDLVAAPGRDGKVRHIKGISEALVERVRLGVEVGKVMRIVGGRHEGLKGEVLLVEKEEGKARVRLRRSEEVVVVMVKDLVDLGTVEEEGRSKSDLQQQGQIDGKRGEWRGEGKGDAEEERGKGRIEEAVSVGKGERRQEAEPAHESRADSEWGQAGGRAEFSSRLEREKVNGREREDSRSRRSKAKEEHQRDRSRDRSRDREEERSGTRDESRRDSKGRRQREGEDKGDCRRRDSRLSPPPAPSNRHQPPAPSFSWLRPSIRVRVVSKKAGGGRLYLKKGTVVDVVTRGVCDLVLDERQELVQGVPESWLETALPKRGGRVMLLSGSEYVGQTGKLLERNGEKGVALVQLAESFELVKVGMECVAEFVGDADNCEG